MRVSRKLPALSSLFHKGVGVGAIPKVGQGPPDLGTGIHAATISNYYNAKPTKEVKFWNNHNTNHFQNKEETKI